MLKREKTEATKIIREKQGNKIVAGAGFEPATSGL
jgi:hypothetical protein